MNIREEQEKYEHEHLSRFASFSDESQGRDRPEEPVRCALHISGTGTEFYTVSRFGA